MAIMVLALEMTVPKSTWRRMAQKASKEQLNAYRLNGDRRSWAVTSHSLDGDAYEVTILDGDLLCSCRGSAFHPYCKHRALVLERLGLLANEDRRDPRPLVPDQVIDALQTAS